MSRYSTSSSTFYEVCVLPALGSFLDPIYNCSTSFNSWRTIFQLFGAWVICAREEVKRRRHLARLVAQNIRRPEWLLADCLGVWCALVQKQQKTSRNMRQSQGSNTPPPPFLGVPLVQKTETTCRFLEAYSQKTVSCAHSSPLLDSCTLKRCKRHKEQSYFDRAVISARVVAAQGNTRCNCFSYEKNGIALVGFLRPTLKIWRLARTVQHFSTSHFPFLEA